MEIKRYSKSEERALFDLLVAEGDDWNDYHGENGRDKYKKALESSITYIAADNSIICGYVRCRDDDGFGIYIYDLLVRKSYRGRDIGKSLMQQVCTDFQDQVVYVMSDVDKYYKKLGFEREGSIFKVTN